MPHKLNCALLVDEDRATNIFNKMVISRHDSFSRVVSVQSTEAAFRYLETIESMETVKPDAIFIEYAISCLKGSDFFEKFNELNNSITKGIKVFIMAPHSDPKIQNKIIRKFHIDELITEPLSFPLLNDILERNFFKIEQDKTSTVNISDS